MSYAHLFDTTHCAEYERALDLAKTHIGARPTPHGVSTHCAEYERALDLAKTHIGARPTPHGVSTHFWEHHSEIESGIRSRCQGPVIATSAASNGE